MTDLEFRDRLRLFRNEKNLSAREMSLSLGQNESYINKIENGQRAVSMEVFFKICDFLEITPKDFFNDDVNNSTACTDNVESILKKLNPKKMEHLLPILYDLL